MTGPRVTAVRAVVGALGVAITAFGVSKLVGEDLGELRDIALWMAGGVVAHDGVVAPTVVLLGVLAMRLTPVWARMSVVTGFVILGSSTVMAIPVLGRFGALPDNPTLLDRNYVGGWAVLGLLTALLVAAGSWRNRRSATLIGPPTSVDGTGAASTSVSSSVPSARAAAEGPSSS